MNKKRRRKPGISGMAALHYPIGRYQTEKLITLIHQLRTSIRNLFAVPEQDNLTQLKSQIHGIHNLVNRIPIGDEEKSLFKDAVQQLTSISVISPKVLGDMSIRLRLFLEHMLPLTVHLEMKDAVSDAVEDTLLILQKPDELNLTVSAISKVSAEPPEPVTVSDAYSPLEQQIVHLEQNMNRGLQEIISELKELRLDINSSHSQFSNSENSKAGMMDCSVVESVIEPQIIMEQEETAVTHLITEEAVRLEHLAAEEEVVEVEEAKAEAEGIAAVIEEIDTQVIQIAEVQDNMSEGTVKHEAESSNDTDLKSAENGTIGGHLMFHVSDSNQSLKAAATIQFSEIKLNGIACNGDGCVSITEAGFYYIDWQITLISAEPTSAQFALVVNGNIEKGKRGQYASPAPDVYTGNALLNLTSAETIELYCISAPPEGSVSLNNARVTIYKIGS
ncbi:collagen-like repeat preface domain-containing protein [Paenibacillus lemnae]|uniref:Collagen-like repeat preface domain-containing protein n=1 Tax=Paenibacillus lemnae TaxID=1330551 RepID=A0A848M8E9_PAELE|nr:collagen-like repeat preface domain-containing protein [Paenibacillus lemnae]NMO96470.1 collagen-like repeat preface domain-containing protein [Paenibacillus lemnae]